MTPEANLLTGIANISRLCMTETRTDFVINMSLYPTKKNSIYMYTKADIYMLGATQKIEL